MRFILGSLALGAGCWFAFMVYTGAVATWSGEQQYIAMLQERSEIEGESIAPVQAAPKLSANERAIRKFSDAELAAELQRRGWIVAEP